MKKYYLKKLTPQELGYRAGVPKGGGRYFYISKDCVEFFPPLSEKIFNDSVLLPMIPPFSEEKIYTKLVYHNDKHNKKEGTRDEYRIYLNKDIDPNREYFEANDIVVMEKYEEKIEDEIIPLYLLYKIKEKDDIYNELNKIIESSKIKGGHALFTGEIDIESKFLGKDENIKIVIPEEIKEEVKSKMSAGEEKKGAHLFNSVSFRDFVLNSYGYKCAITKESIAWESFNNLEAAHIKPRSHKGTFLPSNGIALCRDMHWAFDKGFITINDEYKVVVHGDVKSSLLEKIDGQEIVLPEEVYFKPNKEYLKYHRDNVFGLFKSSGSLKSV